MMRRADFLEVGGFGFEWEPAYYEDADLCLKLWTRCGKVMVNPDARVVHIESKTTSDSQLQLHDISEINRARFVAKWGPWLEARQAHTPPRIWCPSDRARRLRTAVVDPRSGPSAGPAPDPQFVLYSPYPLVPGGGERMLFELASHFSSAWSGRRTSRSRRRTATARRGSARSRHVRLRPCRRDTACPGRRSSRSTAAFSVVLGNSILPADACLRRLQRVPAAIPLLGARSGDRRDGARGWPSFDEIWVYSEFVRRHVNGLVRHYGLAAPPHPGDHPAAPCGPTPTGACPGRSAGRSCRWGASSPVDTTSARTSSSRPSAAWWSRGLEGVELALAGAIHPSPAGRARFYELQELAAGLPCTLYPNIGRADLATLYGRSAVLIHAAGFGVDPDEFPESLWSTSGSRRLRRRASAASRSSTARVVPVTSSGRWAATRPSPRWRSAPTSSLGLLDDPVGSTALSHHLLQSSQVFSAAGVPDAAWTRRCTTSACRTSGGSRLRSATPARSDMMRPSRMSASETMHARRSNRIMTSRSTSAPPKITSWRPSGRPGRLRPLGHRFGAQDVAPARRPPPRSAPRGGSAPCRTPPAPVPGWPASRRCRPGRRAAAAGPGVRQRRDRRRGPVQLGRDGLHRRRHLGRRGRIPAQEALRQPHAADVEGHGRGSRRRPWSRSPWTRRRCRGRRPAASGREVAGGAGVGQPALLAARAAARPARR